MLLLFIKIKGFPPIKKAIPGNKSIKNILKLALNAQINQYYVPTFLPGYRYCAGESTFFEKKGTFWCTFFKKE